MRQLPKMNELHEKYAAKGLHVITLYSQVHKLKQIEELVDKRGIKYPIAHNAYLLGEYQSDSLPMVWIIGVDGKIAFIGDSGYEKVLEKELARVKYPGLGKHKVDEALVPAAEAFAKRNYAEALKLAEAVNDGDPSEAAEADADYIIERIEDRRDGLLNLVDTAEIQGDLEMAIKALEELASDYKGVEDTEEVAERLKELKGSEKTKKELAARHEVLALLYDLDLELENEVDLDDKKQLAAWQRKALGEFRKLAESLKGTWAGNFSADKVKLYEDLLDDGEGKPKEKPEPKGEKQPENPAPKDDDKPAESPKG